MWKQEIEYWICVVTRNKEIERERMRSREISAEPMEGGGRVRGDIKVDGVPQVRESDCNVAPASTDVRGDAFKGGGRAPNRTGVGEDSGEQLRREPEDGSVLCEGLVAGLYVGELGIEGGEGGEEGGTAAQELCAQIGKSVLGRRHGHFKLRYVSCPLLCGPPQ